MKYILFLFLLVQTNYSYCCDCNTIIGLNEAKIVFEGELIQIKRITEPIIRYEITFQVSKIIKGKIQNDVIVINTPCLMDACCGIPFEFTAKYRVYTFEKEGMIYTSACTATKKITDE